MSGKRMKIYIMSVVFGALTSLIALLFFSLLMWGLKLPAEHSKTFSQLALGTGALVCAILAGKFMRRGGMLTGLKASLLFYFPAAIVSVIAGGFNGEVLLGKIVAVMICGVVGGVIGVNQRERI